MQKIARVFASIPTVNILWAHTTNPISLIRYYGINYTRYPKCLPFLEIQYRKLNQIQEELGYKLQDIQKIKINADIKSDSPPHKHHKKRRV